MAVSFGPNKYFSSDTSGGNLQKDHHAKRLLSPDKSNHARADRFFESGMANLAKGKYSDAIADFSKAIERKPSYANAFHNRGYAKYMANDYAGARSDFIEATLLFTKQGDSQFAEIAQKDAMDAARQLKIFNSVELTFGRDKKAAQPAQ